MSCRPLLVCICCLTWLSATALAQDVQLDKISDCLALDQVRSSLSRPVSRSCRSSRNELEAQLMSRLEMANTVKACLLALNPASRLAGFSCFDLDVQGVRELTCFRPIDARARRAYHDNFDPTRTFNYKRAAAACAGTNHDASEAPNTLFPQLLSPVAKADFGFAIGLGDSRIPLATAYHGFAIVDPELRLGTAALEVFDTYQTSASPNSQVLPDATDTIGDWKFEINDMSKASQIEFARPYERVSGERIGVRVRIVDISTLYSFNSSLPERERDLQNWQEAISDYLKSEHLRSLTQAELAGTPFRDTDQIRDLVAKHLPFGKRDFVRVGPSFVVLVNDKYDDCLKLAEVLVTEPEDGVKNDHGGMGFVVLTIGACRESSGPDEFLDKTIRQETKVLEEEVTAH